MHLRLALFLIKWNLLSLYAIGLCVLYPAIPAAFFYSLFLLPWIPLIKSGTVLAGVLLVAGMLILAALWQGWARGGVEPVRRKPVREKAGDIGGLQPVLRALAGDFPVSAPATVQLTLAPAPATPPTAFLDELVSRAPGEAVLPVGCLGVWSAFELRCHLAHAMLRRRGPQWLFRRVSRQLHHLEAEEFTAASAGTDNWRARWLRLVADRLNGEIAKWQLLAGIEADRAVARVYGAELVSSWIRKTWQAAAALPWYKAAFIEPAAGQAMLFPVAEGYVTFHQQMEPTWAQAQEEELADQSEGGPVHPVPLRLEALRRTEWGSSVFDSRPASSLFEDLQSLEEKVVRNELDLPKTQRFRRLEVDEYAQRVLIPLLREDIERNRHIFRTASLEDLPELVARAVTLAESFTPRPLLLLDAAQKRAMIPGLLAAFLLIELADRGWEASFSYWDGFRLRQGDIELDPTRVVQELADGALTADAFLSLIAARSA